MTASSVFVTPLGGSDEVGLNATLYRAGTDCLLVDFGALLLNEGSSPVQKVVLGLEPLMRDGRRVHGVVLTHGHEDHIGGLPYLLERFAVPIYGSPLALALARHRLEQRGLGKTADLRPLSPGQSLSLGPFTVEAIRVTHSIPESTMIALRSAAGNILHTGDFKLDADPWGPATDYDRLDRLANDGLHLLLSDSTNAERAGRSPTESDVQSALRSVIDESAGRVVVTFVASHLDRLNGLLAAARDLGRRVLLVGAAFARLRELGTRLGLSEPAPSVLVGPDEAATVPRNRLVIVATGSQGEPSGGLARLARGEGPIRLEAGDRVVFSARVIPGRLPAIRRLQNQLAKLGVEVVTAGSKPNLHASGHAQQQEQRELIERVRPDYFAPIHGEHLMLRAHAQTARTAGVSGDRIFVLSDGESLELTEGRVRMGPLEEVARVPLGSSGRALSWAEVKTRQRLGRGGLVSCVLAVSDQGALVVDPMIEGRGIDIDARVFAHRVRDELRRATPVSVEEIRQLAVSTIRRELQESAEVAVHVLRL